MQNRNALTSLLCTTAILFMASGALADNLPLKRVVVTTSGVGLYEHEGMVAGDRTIEIPVRLDRVDDMLKSLVVLDNQGGAGNVTLPGREPLSQAFRDLPFDADDLSSLTALLDSLRGADVTITGASAVTGKLMSISEEQTESERGITTRHRIGVLGADGIKTAILENIGALKFTDAGVQAQLERGLNAIFSNRVTDQRLLKIELTGEGSRPVSIAYLQEAPLWKSAYRLVLPGDEEKALLQGWAVLENTTAQDWDNVSVTLMSGAPVTYRQSLYESYYLPRTDLPVKIMDRVIPRADSGAMEGADMAYGGSGLRQQKMMGRAPVMAAAPQMDSVMESAMTLSAAPPMPAMQNMAATIAAAASETASQMVFTVPNPVTLQAGGSLMMPFASHTLPAKNLYVYQPDTNDTHPLASIRIDNDTDSALPPGILTLFDRQQGVLLHVGDAEMPLIPKAENRFISFALDTKTRISRQHDNTRQYGVMTIADGVLKQQIVSLSSTKYTIRAPNEEPREIIIEHPRQNGWELAEPAGLSGAVESTHTHYRLPVKIDAGKSADITVTLRRTDHETIALARITPDDINTRMVAMGKDMPADLKKSFERMLELSANVQAAQTRLKNLEAERRGIFTDQERLRQNLQSVSADNDLGKRYISEMNRQEDRLTQIKQEETQANAALQKAKNALSEYVGTLRH